jgi:hypothetical protein
MWLDEKGTEEVVGKTPSIFSGHFPTTSSVPLARGADIGVHAEGSSEIGK